MRTFVVIALVAVPACSSKGSITCTPPSVGGPGTKMYDAGAAQGDLAVGGGAIWFVQRGKAGLRRQLASFDPRTGMVRGLAPVPSSLSTLRFGEGAIWGIASGGETRSRLVAFDPGSGQRTLDVPLPGRALTMDVGEGSVWVVLEDGTLVRVEPRSGHMHAVSLPAEATGIVVGLGSAWVDTQVMVTKIRARDSITEIDPRTETAIRSIPGVSGKTVGSDVLWVDGPGEPNGAIRRLDPSTGRLLPGIVSVEGIQPSDVATEGASAWVAHFHYYCELHNPVPEGPPIVDWVAYRLSADLKPATRSVRISLAGSSPIVALDGSLYSLVGDGPGHIIQVNAPAG